MLEFRTSRWKSLLLLSCCLMFVAMGYLMANDPSLRGTGVHFWSWAVVLFFGLGIPVSLREMFRTGPRLIISDAGIEDCTNHLGLIPWAEIASIDVWAISGQSSLLLSMHNPEPWVSRLPARLRWGVRASRALGFPEIHISISGLTTKPSEVAEHVHCYFHAWRMAV